MKYTLLLILLCSFLYVEAQPVTPKWIILEKGNSVGIVKPGVNDVMYYIGSKMRNLDKAAFEEINNSISFTAGSTVLVYGNVNNDYMATDIEGRTLVIKGKLTNAEQKAGSGVGYIKENMSIDGINVKRGMYVWIKSNNTKNATLTIQYANNKTFEIPLDKVFIMDNTTAEMVSDIAFKAVN